ncbi:hypothetical protein PV326_009135 [Microctonus aethiopoides]|nr:hypothetical protein PV326_009135 [Microctonus aethiopoides]
MAKIEMLNYDVLREIFSYLDIYDRQRMGLANIEKPLKRFASQLKKIQIATENRKDFPLNVYKLLTECTNLNYAQLECVRSRSVERFLEFMPHDNLEHLSIRLFLTYQSVRVKMNHLMDNILAKAPKLKCLDLYHVPITELSSIGGMSTLKILFLEGKVLPRLNFDMKKLQNLETLCIKYRKVHAADIEELLRNCKQLHSLCIECDDILPETILNEIMSLSNLRRLHLSTTKNSYEQWYKFSNLEQILILQQKPLFTTRDQIVNFFQRSKNLVSYYFETNSRRYRDFNEIFHEVASDIGHECKRKFSFEWTEWEMDTFF